MSYVHPVISNIVGKFDDIPTKKSYTLSKRHHKESAEILGEHVAIGLEQAKDTLKTTFQRAARLALFLISRRYWADQQLNVGQLSGKFADTGHPKSLVTNAGFEGSPPL